MKIISLQLPEDLIKRIKEDSENNFMTPSAFLRMIIIKYYKDVTGN